MHLPAPLTNEEIGHLRHYIALHRRRGWWQRHGSVALLPLPVLLLIASQFVGRWLPGYLEAHGIALCTSHPTVHRGMVWWPSEPGLRAVLRGTSGLMLLCAFYLGTLVAGTWVNDLRGQRMARILLRLHPEVGPMKAPDSPLPR